MSLLFGVIFHIFKSTEPYLVISFPTDDFLCSPFNFWTISDNEKT